MNIKFLSLLLIGIFAFLVNTQAQEVRIIAEKELEGGVIKQFEDKGLAHYSYAITVAGQMVLVDPSRDPQPYLDYARSMNAQIIGIIETHPHADFASGHFEIHQLTGADIYVSEKVGADYPHIAFDEGDEITLSDQIQLRALFTPGHSPDGISILVVENGEVKAVFTGDTLFVGDVGRPDLRESAGNIQEKKEKLARQMYHSSREKLMKLPEETVVYPTHGAGSLCGKALSDQPSSTIGAEIRTNYALQKMSEEEFVKLILADQPFIPKYFPYNVAVNKAGVPALQASINEIPLLPSASALEESILLIDVRSKDEFDASHLTNAINIMNGGKFETWLGSIIEPEKPFYIIANSKEQLDEVVYKASKIAYDLHIKGGLIYEGEGNQQVQAFDRKSFDTNPKKYTLVDVRSESEIKENPIFEASLVIPITDLKERIEEIPNDKPIVIHCASGYRSTAARSIIKKHKPDWEVYDMSTIVKEYMNQ
ncbi:MAG: MBL fold metallo-hydrolase [Cyclobacteriaceae bacterium]|nr:MBL fold metallo-hydrolase [Cyclobacteriaceae bacterium]MCH8515387.1 MBL fold metallo-hydrolase [Cyclobacteriaceae bacterium]